MRRMLWEVGGVPRALLVTRLWGGLLAHVFVLFCVCVLIPAQCSE